MNHGTISIWRAETAPRTSPRPSLRRDLEVDVAVVGAGVTGLTLGVLLAEEGLRVAVLERLERGAGTTGGTTAHLTEALDTDYATLVSRFGEEAIRLVVQSVRRAIREIERRATLAGRGCGFRRLPGFRFTEDPKQLGQLEREEKAARAVGVDAACVAHVPLPFPVAGALRFEAQAEVQPLAYLDLLAETFLAAGGELYEDTPVVGATGKQVVVAGGPRVDARFVVDATHTPLGLAPSIQARLTAMTSYVLAARVSTPIGAGLFWDTEDPYHYLRALGPRGDRVLIGGADHHTGRVDDPGRALEDLLRWTRERFGVAAVEARWSAELFEPADGLPYIGALPSDHARFVAAGFSGTGITFGTVAALVIAESIVRGSSPWEQVYAPGRLKPLAEGPAVARENARIAWRFVADRLRQDGPRELAPDTGRIERHGGHQVAVYRDPAGRLHRLSPRCRHLGCVVRWNDFEKSWDCPCHGGRYRGDGRVLYGPPTADLAPDEADAEASDSFRAPR